MMAAFVMLSGMMLTGESMQIYGDDNRSFESCQLDLETQAMKTSNENLLLASMRPRRYAHADMDTDAHTDYSQSH